MRRCVAVLTTSVLTFGAVFALSAAPAGAATVNYSCAAWDAADPNGPPLTEEPVALPVENVTATAPAQVRPFETFQVEVPARTMFVPTEVISGGAPFSVDWVQNLVWRVKINGGTIVPGSLVKSGGPASATATLNTEGNWAEIKIPNRVFSGNFMSFPGITFDVTAGESGSVKTTTRTGVTFNDQTMTVSVLDGLLVVLVRCTSQFITLSSTGIAGEPFPTTTTSAPSTTTTLATTTTSPSVTTLQTPTTTAAPAELPRTGSTSGPLGLAGFAALVAGLAVLGVTRRRLQAASEE